jgi:putative flavoprotein involved in K+ transport
MPFPPPSYYFPTKDEMGDYLEAYATRFKLPVRTGVRVDCLSRQGKRFVVTAGDQQFESEHVVVAMANQQKPYVPPFTQELNSSLVQLHADEYRNPSQLQEGVSSSWERAIRVLKSPSKLPIHIQRGYRVEIRATSHFASRDSRLLLNHLVLRLIFHRVMTVRTPIGRKVRPKLLSHGLPLVRVKPKDITAAGIKRVPQMTGVRNGLALLEDGRILDVANIIWCTGFRPGFSWIDLPILKEEEPIHEHGVVANEPGLYFVGHD